MINSSILNAKPLTSKENEGSSDIRHNMIISRALIEKSRDPDALLALKRELATLEVQDLVFLKLKEKRVKLSSGDERFEFSMSFNADEFLELVCDKLNETQRENEQLKAKISNLQAQVDLYRAVRGV